jgi:hypothetical protein
MVGNLKHYGSQVRLNRPVLPLLEGFDIGIAGSHVPAPRLPDGRRATGWLHPRAVGVTGLWPVDKSCLGTVLVADCIGQTTAEHNAVRRKRHASASRGSGKRKSAHGE